MQALKDNQCYMWDKCRRIRMALTDRGYDLKYFLDGRVNWKRFLLDSTAIIFYFINDKMFDKGEKIYG